MSYARCPDDSQTGWDRRCLSSGAGIQQGLHGFHGVGAQGTEGIEIGVRLRGLHIIQLKSHSH